MRWIQSGDLLFVKWMDSSEVAMCSTIHGAYSGQTVQRKVKTAGVWQSKSIPVPDCIVDYNQCMGGVDLSDALIGYYSVRHKTMKWYKTFFNHFVDIAVVNSYLLHKELFKLRQDAAQTKPFTHKAFTEQLAKEMLLFAGCPLDKLMPTPSHPYNMCMPTFYTGGLRTRKSCKRCKDNGMPKVKTSAYCTKCMVPLCYSAKKNCFLLWHTGE
ncbi:mitochondrial import inner membrane translocase subunit Tim29 isoform X3 [Pseudoliparis swirei]|uniref:mitochondrial import inner membrane translocase subunit Tim29 isoform X3 n=1 Tax=Pseudoliparis swirei TaxID=2059687 RepID=UPI0024BD8C0D|nr:mitochondrial import inner membrane translocase subunit Tim29 isoform X3 [Pseudoliparis swirei]